MQVVTLEGHCPNCGSSPPQGWIVRGPAFSVCNVANLRQEVNLSEVMDRLIETSRY